MEIRSFLAFELPENIQNLTLGRFKKGARPWPHPDHMISGGAVYTKLDAWPLGGIEKL